MPRAEAKSKLMIDTSQIDKKIEDIRKKYQEYGGQAINYKNTTLNNQNNIQNQLYRKHSN